MKPEILKGKNLEKFVNQALAQQLPVKYVTKMISLSYGGMFSAEEIRDSLSDGQLLSKLWLLDKFELIAKSDMNVCIVGGWLGQLANLLFLNKPQVKNIVSLDVDSRCRSAADFINSDFYDRFTAATFDGLELDYSSCKDALVINTSMEHFENPKAWLNLLPSGTRVILQANDNELIEDHVSCPKSLDEFIQLTDLDLVYAGELQLPQYIRFMVMGTIK